MKQEQEKLVGWQQKRVVVTGGSGFLGSSVVDKLRARGYQNIMVPRSKNYDLRDQKAIIQLYEDAQPQVVIHLAAVVGGIGANRANPGRFFYDNAVMGIQLMEYARQFRLINSLQWNDLCLPQVCTCSF
jgi:GDP-L-fucose synthase